MDDQGAVDLGSCFHFIPDIKYLENGKCLSNYSPCLECRGMGSLGVLIDIMQNHPATHKPPQSQRLDTVPGRPSASVSQPQCLAHDAFLLHGCLLAFVV